MKRWSKQFWSILVAFALVFIAKESFADELILEFDADEEIRFEDFQSIPPATPSNRKEAQEKFREGYQQLFQFNDQEIQGLKAVIFPLQQDISSLDSQLQYLAAQSERIRRQELLVAEKIQGLQQLQEKFMIQDQLLSLELKGIVMKFEKLVVLFYRIKREFVMEDGRVNLAQLFSNTSSPSDVLFQDYLLSKIQSQLLDQMNIVSVHQFQLSILRAELTAIQEQMMLYRERLVSSVGVLAEQEQFQQQLLSEKRDEQQFFEKALEEAIAEQKIITQRIQELAGGISPRTYQGFPLEQFQWPVDPALGISAHFQDEGYRNRFGIDHNAIDIPTDQLTPVRAAMSGKVIKVHEAGLGYNYVQLAHRDGFSTVYGHIYEFKVKEGDVIAQNQVIALSGGAIGTKGAGRLTTGPHLHFEILKDGKYVNPMEFLVQFDL
jgi:murein DD-endopeptidase MepM/ murein hydrolase activator NlpD